MGLDINGLPRGVVCDQGGGVVCDQGGGVVNGYVHTLLYL